MSSRDADGSDAAHTVSDDAERATLLGAALEHAQREERNELADDISRKQATDDRIVAALTKAQSPHA